MLIYGLTPDQVQAAADAAGLPLVDGVTPKSGDCVRARLPDHTPPDDHQRFLTMVFSINPGARVRTVRGHFYSHDVGASTL